MCFEYFIYFKGKIRWNIETIFFFCVLFSTADSNNFEKGATFHSELKEIERDFLPSRQSNASSFFSEYNIPQMDQFFITVHTLHLYYT